jgi:D-serine deaminase-like pyridoxal phosphate-dependent protein
MSFNLLHLADTIDRLGFIKAQIAELLREEKELKATLIARGPGAYEGSLYRATVSESERETLDMDAVRAKLSPQFISANTNTTQVVMVRVVARNDESLSAD